MTDLPSSAPAARRPPQRRRGTTDFLVVCLLAFVMVAAGLHFLGPGQRHPG
jgi:hypothetical protein